MVAGRSITRRAVLAASLAGLVVGRAQADVPTIKVGVLRFGTVSWELDVLRAHGLDKAAGIAVEPVEFASAQATPVALQAGAVDMIALDWLWVSRQRSTGADWTFSPLSNAVGAVEVPAVSPIESIADLAGKRLGIAGTPIDKSWLILRAYAQRKLGLDLDASVEKSFGVPPLLAAAMNSGQLDAVLTFWPYAARAEAEGARRLISMEDALADLGVAATVPMVGYVFSEKWAGQHRAAVDGFLGAAADAREMLVGSDAEWQRLKPLTGAKSDAELKRLKEWYRTGVPRGPGTEEATKLYKLLAKIGGPALVGDAPEIAPGTFWVSGQQ